MARQKKKGSFLLGMILYALIFSAIILAGLRVFWDFIDSYERSRPKNTMDAYIASLTVEEMLDNCTTWESVVDGTIQSEESFRQVVRDSLTGKITYARKSSVCTETSQTYVLRSGSQVLGEVEIEAGVADRWGFTVWEVYQHSFDFAYLLCEDQSVTVPASYTVTANGEPLDETYITESGMIYTELEEFYDDYPTLPTMVTYSAGSVLGELQLQVLDENGTVMENWSEENLTDILNNCTAEEAAMLERYMGGFLDSYVTFCSSANQAVTLNYLELLNNYLIEGSDLAHRLYTAMDGLSFAQSYSDTIDEIQVHQVTKVDESRYFCDVTYLVSTWGKAGKVQTTNNMKVVLVETGAGLRVETMTRY